MGVAPVTQHDSERKSKPSKPEPGVQRNNSNNKLTVSGQKRIGTLYL
jgi:hypothetical protein